MNKAERVKKLTELGWLKWPTDDVPDVALEAAKSGYATFHGVSNDWPAIEQHWTLPRCALPDNLPVTLGISRWGKRDLKWTIVDDLPGHSRAQFRDAMTESLRRISAVCNVKNTWVDSPNQADLVVHMRSIDNSGGVLAEAELPGENSTRQLNLWFDDRDRWTIKLEGDPGNLIDCVRVGTHEFCHNFGLRHIQAGNLMAPVYSRTIWKPMTGDIAELQNRYGPPVTQPQPNPQPTPTPGGDSMLGTILKLLPFLSQFSKYLPDIIKYLPQIIALIEELSKLFKTNPQALDNFVAELKTLDAQELRLAMTADTPERLTADDIFTQIMILLRSIASAVGVHVNVDSGKTTVDVDVKTKRDAVPVTP